jgi:hypothetical protein
MSNSKKGKKICVYLSSRAKNPKFKKATTEVGLSIIENGYEMVWGGSNNGLMKILADTVKKNDGTMHAVTLEHHIDEVHPSADTTYVAKNTSEKQKRIRTISDAFLILPGGIGTFFELGDLLEELKINTEFDKPLAIINSDRFYTPLLHQFEKMEEESLLYKKLRRYLKFFDKTKDAFKYLDRKLT